MRTITKISFLAVVLSLFVLASGGPAAGSGGGEDLEIGGLILSRMQTPMGHEFYTYFCSDFSPPTGIGNYNIVLKEKASAQWGSWIWVEVNDVIVFRILLSPRRGDVEKAAKEAAARTLRFLLRSKLKINDDGTEDLADDGY